jgi:hypothetical protein
MQQTTFSESELSDALSNVSSDRDKRYRLVDRYVVHGGCEPFVAKVARVLPPDTQYVVLDLDRTVHVGLTIGECLGWEVLSHPGGPRPDDRDTTPYLAWSRPLATASRLARGMKVWGLPGLVYALTVRLGDRWDGWHRMLVRRRGVDYVERMQALMRSTLMTTTAGYTHSELQAYAERAWQRWRSRLVVTRAAIDEIRRNCPQLRRIILSSASTEPTVAHAATELGVDGFVSSAVDILADGGQRDGGGGARDVYTGPSGLPTWITRRRPGLLSRPGAVIHNAAENKISLLRARYPEVFARDAVSVAVSDNNYGEDRSWSDHFVHVVALNSKHPYSPIVAARSPCVSIQALDAMPEQRDDSVSGPVVGELTAEEFDRPSLEDRIGIDVLPRLEQFAAALVKLRDGGTTGRDDSLRRKFASLAARTSDAIARYNQAGGVAKSAAARELARLDRRTRKLRTELARAGRAGARVECEIELLRSATGRMVAVRAD